MHRPPVRELSTTLSTCAYAIENGQPIVIEKNGTWHRLDPFVAFVRKTIGRKDSLSLAQNLHQVLLSTLLNSRKRKGLPTLDEATRIQMIRLIKAAKKRIAPETLAEQTAFKALQVARNALDPKDPKQLNEIIKLNNQLKTYSHTPALQTTTLLQQMQIALETLSLSQQALSERPFSQADLDWLKHETTMWQERQFPYVDYVKDNPNKEAVFAKLTLCCRYKTFITACKKNSFLLEYCFDSLLKGFPDNSPDSVHLFMQAPYLLKELQRAALDRRIRELNNDGLRFVGTIDEDGAPIKDVLLLIDGRFQSIAQASSEVHLSERRKLRVDELFAEFRKQERTTPTVEYLQEGVKDFDGRLSLSLLEHKDWWTRLPIVRRMTRQEISETYGVPFDEGYGLLALRASRAKPVVEAADNHAWMDIALPLPDGTFSVISPGKYSEIFPVTFSEIFHFVFRSHKASLTVTDLNMSQNARERMALPLPPLTEERFTALMELLRTDFIRSLKGELVFQVQGDNCAEWVMSIIQRLYPNCASSPYKTAFHNVLFPPFLMPLIWARHIFPSQGLWNTFRIGFNCLFGALESLPLPDEHMGLHTIRLYDHAVWSSGYLEVPSALFLYRGSLAGKLARLKGIAGFGRF